MDPANACLAAAALAEFDGARVARARRAGDLASRLEGVGGLRMLTTDRVEDGAYPRLACVARDAAQRDALLAALRPLGASAFYPSSIDAIPALEPHLVGACECPSARDLAARLLTLPTHAGMSARQVESARKAVKRL
jgi:dTDP-4-amino-4,6-dideoxygalactose transaminase